MIQEENLENINLSYESRSQQKLQLDKLCDDFFKYQLTQNELKEIMERPAERSLVILKWKKYGKDHSRVATDSDGHLSEHQKRAQPQQTSSQNCEPSTAHKLSYPLTFDQKHNLIDRSKAESSKKRYLPFQIQKSNNKAAEIPNMDKKMTMT